MKEFLKAAAEELGWSSRVILSSLDRFYWDNGFSRAASLAYTTLLSLVPLLALVFGLLGSFAVSNEMLPGVRDFVFRQFIPDLETTNTAIQYLAQFSASVMGMNALVIGVVALTSILLLNSIESALNEIWQVYESRSIPQRLAIFCAIIVIAPVLAVSTYYFATLRLEPLFVGRNYYVESFISLYHHLLPFMIDLAAFFTLYYLVPKTSVRIRAALIGGIVAALLFDAAKLGFAYYIDKFSSYDKIYGTLSSIPVFLFWLYLAWTIIIFGAEVSYQAQNLPRQGRLWKRSLMSIGDGALVLAVQALVMVARSFVGGKRPMTVLELAGRLGCSTVVLRPILSSLERAGIITRTATSEEFVTLLRSPETIMLAEIQETVLGTRGTAGCESVLSKLFAHYKEQQLDAELTLRSLLDEEKEPT